MARTYSRDDVDTHSDRFGPKWVTAWSFHPDARIYPNTPYRFPVDGRVRILAT